MKFKCFRKISKIDGEKKAKELESLFVEVSAKSGINIEDLFQTITSSLPGLEQSQSQIISTRPNSN